MLLDRAALMLRPSMEMGVHGAMVRVLDIRDEPDVWFKYCIELKARGHLGNLFY